MKPIASLTDDELIRHLRRAVRALPDVPAALQRAALALWPPAPAAGGLMQAAQALLQQIAGVLSFDSWATPGAALGMRSLRSPTRHLLYSAQGRDIDLRISPAAQAYALAGQVLGPDDAGLVELSGPAAKGSSTRQARLDAMGEFRIDGLARGTYVLTLRLGGDEVLLPAFEVGEPGS